MSGSGCSDGSRHTALIGDPRRRPRRPAPFASGLLLPGWRIEDLVLIALGTGSILFDGLSQTQPWFEVFGAPGVPIKTLQLLGFLGLIVVAALLVSRLVGLPATAAGLLPIAAGYLVAHYFTYLLIDGQRIIVASPTRSSRAGTSATSAGRSSSRRRRSCRRASSGRSSWRRSSAGTCSARGPAMSCAARESGAARGARAHRQREVPLAVIMVALTTLTLWSLGQALVVEAPSTSVRSRGPDLLATRSTRSPEARFRIVRIRTPLETNAILV